MFSHSRKADPQKLTTLLYQTFKLAWILALQFQGESAPYPCYLNQRNISSKLPKHKKVILKIAKAKHSHSRLKF